MFKNVYEKKDNVSYLTNISTIMNHHMTHSFNNIKISKNLNSWYLNIMLKNFEN